MLLINNQNSNILNIDKLYIFFLIILSLYLDVF